VIAAGELDWRVSRVIAELQAYLPGAPAAATRARFLEREKTAGKSVEQCRKESQERAEMQAEKRQQLTAAKKQKASPSAKPAAAPRSRGAAIGRAEYSTQQAESWYRLCNLTDQTGYRALSDTAGFKQWKSDGYNNCGIRELRRRETGQVPAEDFCFSVMGKSAPKCCVCACTHASSPASQLRAEILTSPEADRFLSVVVKLHWKRF